MHATTRHYARALYELTEHASDAEVDTYVGDFVRILAQARMLSTIDRIIADFRCEYNQRNGIVEATVTAARELTAQQQKQIADTLHASLGATIEIHTAVDPRLIGGVSIRYHDVVIDGSVATQLREMGGAMRAHA